MADKPATIKKLSEKNTKQAAIAEKTIESTAQAKSFADLQKLLVDQGRKAAGEK